MHKDIQTKLFEEIRQVMPSKSSHIDLDMLNKLPYLDQVVNEAMRILPVVPFATRHTSAEIVLDGYTIPKDVGILVPIMKLHRSTKYWGEDANEFKPERFEYEKFKKIHPYAFIPFTSEFLIYFLKK